MILQHAAQCRDRRIVQTATSLGCKGCGNSAHRQDPEPPCVIGDICGAEQGLFVCELPQGHEGEHERGDPTSTLPGAYSARWGRAAPVSARRATPGENWAAYAGWLEGKVEEALGAMRLLPGVSGEEWIRRADAFRAAMAERRPK